MFALHHAPLFAPMHKSMSACTWSALPRPRRMCVYVYVCVHRCDQAAYPCAAHTCRHKPFQSRTCQGTVIACGRAGTGHTQETDTGRACKAGVLAHTHTHTHTHTHDRRTDHVNVSRLPHMCMYMCVSVYSCRAACSVCLHGLNTQCALYATVTHMTRVSHGVHVPAYPPTSV